MGLYIGLMLLLSAFVLRYFISRKQYYRRFNNERLSYERMLGRRIKTNASIFVCYVLFTMGVLCILFHYTYEGPRPWEHHHLHSVAKKAR